MSDKNKDKNKANSLDLLPLHEHMEIYRKIKNYSVSNEGMLIYNGDSPLPLCHGSIVIKEELHKRDGTDTTEIFFRIEGVTRTGSRLPLVTVAAADFNSLNWITKAWGSAIVVMPKQTAKQTLAAGILLTGQQGVRKTVYTHTGYLMENGHPIDYLSVSGALINPDINCEIIQGLSRYKLAGISKSDEERVVSIKTSVSFLYAHAPEVTAPLFAFVYLIPILSIISKVIGDTSFLMFLLGKTQSGKSTLAALAMSHFGRFDSQTPPTTFASTHNAIGEMAFILKDLVLWIDDYHPKQNPSEANDQNKVFQMLVRMSGDHATRRRLDSNAKLKDERPPRCAFLVTGEDSPRIGQSGHARVFQLDVPETRKDISEIKKAAREGVLSRAMSDYIAYIIANYDQVMTVIKERYDELFNRSSEIFGETRLTNQATLLCLSAYMFFDYAVRCKALEETEAKKLYSAIESSVVNNARKQEDKLKQEDPCTMYISAIKDLLSSGRAAVLDISKSSAVSLVDREGVRFIGWKDDKGYYLNANSSYSAVSDYYADQNMMFVVNPNTLWKQLRDSKLLIPDKSNGTPQSQKCIDKTNKRVLWFNPTLFDSQE